MARRLQPTGHRESPYERPNQKWVCGWSEDGNACPMGPDRRGRCTAEGQSHCQPRREGDRFVCTRPVVFGGECERGPRPDGTCCRPQPTHPVCQPRLSIRARRGLVTRSVVALTIGLLALYLGGPWILESVSPGELTSAHAGITRAGDADQRCVACHEAGSPSPATWLAAALGSGSGAGDSARCLNCHFRTGGADTAMYAHGDPGLEPVPVSATDPAEGVGDHDANGQPAVDEGGADPSATPPAAAAVARRARGPMRSNGAIACATCHREHRGPDHALSALDNRRCQACHRIRFDGLGDGHPEFEPAGPSPGGIRFDHVAHQAQFGDTEFACSRCHVGTTSEARVATRPFAQACAGCHNQGRSDHHGDTIRQKAVVLVQLPYLEFEEVEEYWPEEVATGAELTPTLLLLLAGDPEADEALESLHDEDVDWIPEDWYPDDEIKVQLTDAIKRLIVDLGSRDAAALARRLARALDAEADDPAVAAYAEQLAAGGYAASAFRLGWLPGIDGDADDTTVGEALADASARAGWFVDADEATLNYRPTGHGDPLLRAWIVALFTHADPTRSADDEEIAGVVRRQVFAMSTRSGILRTTCLRCHTTEGPDDTMQLAWSAAASPGSRYTRFDHGPHLAGNAGDCSACHQVAAEDHEDRALLARGMLPQERRQCAQCHTPGGSNDDCLACHVYHAQRP